MDFLALVAAFAQPPDHLIAGHLAVGHHAEQLAGALRTEVLGRKRQFRLIAKRQLAQRLADRQEPVIRLLAGIARPVGYVADLGPFFILNPAVDRLLV